MGAPTASFLFFYTQDEESSIDGHEPIITAEISYSDKEKKEGLIFQELMIMFD